MIERRCWKPFLVLIFSFIVALLAVKYCLKESHQQKKVKTTSPVVAVISPIRNQPRQVISITACDCWIKNFDYQDQRMMSSGDQSGIEKKAENGDLESSKKISVKRQYLGDAVMAFELKGTPSREGLLHIANAKGLVTNYYCYAIRFDKSGVAGIVVMMKKSQITTIYQESPKLKTLFQYTGAI